MLENKSKLALVKLKSEPRTLSDSVTEISAFEKGRALGKGLILSERLSGSRGKIKFAPIFSVGKEV